MSGINYRTEQEEIQRTLKFKPNADIPTKIGYSYYQSGTNGNWFLRRTKDQRIIASFVEKEHLILFLNAL
jgi:hypothetical protein